MNKKSQATNSWKDGLNKDLNPVVTPNTVLTDNLNGTFITYNGNELVLQNDMGNVKSTELSDGFYPIGVQEYGDIIYIVSIKQKNIYKITANVTYTDENRKDIIDELIEATGLSERKVLSLLDGTLYIDSNTTLESVVSALNDLSYVRITYIDPNVPVNQFEVGSFPSLPDNIEEEDEHPMQYKYRPFRNLVVNGDPTDFSTSYLSGYEKTNPVSIEVQPSYDGSVNLILTDGKNKPRIINSGFAVTSNGKGKLTKRNQNQHTNYYDEDYVDELTTLINTSIYFTTVDLGILDENNKYTSGVQQGGQLKGGNYTFYFRLGDEDGNKTDIVCESGIVSVFKGNPGNPRTISGTLYNEVTDKLISLTLNNIDTSYSRIYVSYTREYSDANGFRLVEAIEILEPFKIFGSNQVVTISGVEQTQEISVEELNILYYTVSSAKAITQQQNMLFLGNVTTEQADSSQLQELSYNVEITIEQDGDGIGSVSPFNYETSDGSEYYDPQNIYYKLGYWPDELYRLGIVYIKADGTNTQVFNLKGCSFSKINDSNQKNGHLSVEKNETNVSDGVFIDNSEQLDNIAGVFKTPDVNVLQPGNIWPLYFTAYISEYLAYKLSKLGIVGYFIVRQKRIPITICQGFGVGIDKYSYIPMLYYQGRYVAESFVTRNTDDEKTSRLLTYSNFSLNGDETSVKTNAGFYVYIHYYVTRINWLLSVLNVWEQHYVIYVIGPKDNNLDHVYWKYDTTNRQEGLKKASDWYKEKYDGKTLDIHEKSSMTWNASRIDTNENNESYKKERAISEAQSGGYGLLSVEAMTNPQLQSVLCGTEFTIDPINQCDLGRCGQMFMAKDYASTKKSSFTGKLVYMPSGTAVKWIDNVGFSNQVGDAANISNFGFLEELNDDANADNVIRGMYTPYIAVVTENLEPNYLYNIRLKHDDTYKLDFKARSNDNSEYYAVTNKIPLKDCVNIYRGDCFSSTVTVRMNRNFVDQTVPTADRILIEDAWQKYYKGYSNISYSDDDDKSEYTQWDNINLADVNTVSLGEWVTFKCLSNTNIGLRSEDTSNTTEMAIFGNSRSFYPLVSASTATGMKLEESTLLNSGYNATVGRKRNILKLKTPYDKNEFTNRILFSNISVTDSFTNGYRTFQGVSYKDYTKQYGSIVKLLPLKSDLFCVFEHGISIIPINEKALMQTTTEQTIHIYGHGVLPEQMTIVSQDFGSIWADSVIRTPIGIYGVDTSAKKIWKFTSNEGLQCISDMKMQRFLNDNINLNLVRQVELGVTNVKTHYNNYKGDVMFTFYNNDKIWNICYNERQDLWVTRYDWYPLHSANINNSFYSFDVQNPQPIWKHGRSGIDNQMLPTKWYNTQHPFEFEFVVTEPMGLHKIFENLAIISNNVQPKELEFELIGDAYLFNKARIYHDCTNIYGDTENDVPYEIDSSKFTKDLYSTSTFSPIFYNATVNYDKVLDTYTLVVNQECKNVETYGRRLGNIQYKEDCWYTNIEPLCYNKNLKDSTVTTYSTSDEFAETKLRDKWVKVRVKYTGDQLATIHAIMMSQNISYA